MRNERVWRKEKITTAKKCKKRPHIEERRSAKRDIANCCSRNVPDWKEGSENG